MWGHGRNFSSGQSKLLAKAKLVLTMRSEWFFAYTPKGASHLINHGYPDSRITVLNNTIDTDDLRKRLNAVGRIEVANLSARLGLTPGRTGLFLGGVDESKNITFLIEASKLIARQVPGFTLLIGGTGARMASVLDAEKSGAPIRVLGRLDGHAKAAVLKVSDLMLIPRGIGLVAVDALTAGLPIMTTNDLHGPEQEYLTTGRTAVFTEVNLEAYCRSVADILWSPELLGQMQRACHQDSARYSLEWTTTQFMSGIERWIFSRSQQGLP